VTAIEPAPLPYRFGWFGVAAAAVGLSVWLGHFLSR